MIVWAATGRAYAPEHPYVVLSWNRQPQPDDYTRTDTYTLSVDQPGVSTELIRSSVNYQKAMYDAGFAAPDPTRCDSWGEAVVDLRTLR